MLIDTHAHLDGEEFAADLPVVIERAKAAGVEKVFVPAIDQKTSGTVLQLCRENKGFAYPMIGLHPEEVRADYAEVIGQMRQMLTAEHIAIGEVGLDFYWSREYENEQLHAFEEQVRWSIDSHLPLMIHCRKAQNEMVAIMRKYRGQLHGGVFHCFTGNRLEADRKSVV